MHTLSFLQIYNTVFYESQTVVEPGEHAQVQFPLSHHRNIHRNSLHQMFACKNNEWIFLQFFSHIGNLRAAVIALVLQYKVLHNWGSTERIINCLINAVLLFFVHIVYTSGSCSKWSPEDHYYHGCWPHPQNTYNIPEARSIWIWSKPNPPVPHHSRYINMFCKINMTQLSEY